QSARATNVGAPYTNSVYGFNIGGGGIFDASTNYFKGLIEDVAVFNSALNSNQIQNLYSAGAPAIGFAANVLSNNPAGYWRMNDAAGSALAYDSVEAHNGVNASVTLGVAGLQPP